MTLLLNCVTFCLFRPMITQAVQVWAMDKALSLQRRQTCYVRKASVFCHLEVVHMWWLQQNQEIYTGKLIANVALVAQVHCIMHYGMIGVLKIKIRDSSQRGFDAYSANFLIWIWTPLIRGKSSLEWFLIHFGGKLVDVLLPVSKFVMKVDHIRD